MSDFDDDSPYDDDDLKQLYEEQHEEEYQQIFELVMINRRKMVRTKIELRDKNNELVSVSEVIKDLVDYMTSNLTSGEPNQLNDQLYPLMGQILSVAMPYVSGSNLAALYLGTEHSRYSFHHMMLLSFLLLKYVQQKKITIHAIETPITISEIEELEAHNRDLTAAQTVTQLDGEAFTKVVEDLTSRGILNIEQLQDVVNKVKQGKH